MSTAANGTMLAATREGAGCRRFRASGQQGSAKQVGDAARRVRTLQGASDRAARPRRRLVASRWLGPADDILLHPAILVAIATWALNDHVLKPLLANARTGKLSDVVSLAAGPAVLAALLCRCSPWLARHVLALTAGFAPLLAAVMASINTLPEAGDAYRWGLGLAQWPWRCAWSWLHGGSTVPLALVDLTMDPTDLWTIPAAAISPWVAWRLHR